MTETPRTAGRRGSRRPVAAILALLLLLPLTLSAQYFGRNKVRWEQFDWQVLKTEHFDIYYYPQAEANVRVAARLAERWYDRLSAVFGREFTERKPVIFYANQTDFQQTTAIRGFIGQGTGGVTEALKTRVVLPFTGDFGETNHVLGHELVHVFQYDILFDRGLAEGGVRGGGPVDVPLWFIEGLAEYLSLGRVSPHTAMWLRDALARDSLPDLEDLSRDPRLFPYRWGHAFWAYVGGRWGDAAVARVFIRGTRIGVEGALQEVLGTSMEDFSEAWKASIRETYGPVIEGRVVPARVGTRILPEDLDRRDIYISPVLSPDGSTVALLSTRGLFSFDLYLADARTGEIRQKLFSADADPHFDALRFLDSAGTWSPDGRQFAFVVLSKGDNQIAILDTGSGRIEQRIQPEGVEAMWNPAWSPDGRFIAFSGAKGGITDLYLHELETGRTRALTDDPFGDLQPEWSPDGRTLAFVSDRGAGEVEDLAQAPMGIWLLDVETRRVREAAILAGGNRTNPRFGPGGRDLYFLSDRDGVSDLYRTSLATGETFRVTNLTTGISGIGRLSPALTVSERTGRVLFSVFQDSSYTIHSLEPEQARGEPVSAAPAEALPRAAVLPPLEPRRQSLVSQYLLEPAQLPAIRPELEEYDPKLELDFLGPAVGVGVSSFGTSVGGDISAFFSDVLGHHEVGVSLQGATGEIDELGGQAYYLNQEGRWQLGGALSWIPYVSAFTSVRGDTVVVDGQEVQATVYSQVREKVTQQRASAIAHYPLSTTRRFESAVGYTRLDFDAELREVVAVGSQVLDRTERDLRSPEGIDYYQASFAFVGDSSYFGYTSPVRGRRYRLEVEPTFGDLDFQAVTADFRNYTFWRPVTLAVRALHFGRYGDDAESGRITPIYLGRPTLVRGYELGDIDISECTPIPGDPEACPEFDRLVGSRIGVVNLELRVPLFGTESFGLVTMPFLPTELSAFVDVGTAWTSASSPELKFEERSFERVPVVSAGLSARVLLGGFAVLEFYYAKPFQRPEEDWVTGFLISPGW